MAALRAPLEKEENLKLVQIEKELLATGLYTADSIAVLMEKMREKLFAANGNGLLEGGDDQLMSTSHRPLLGYASRLLGPLISPEFDLSHLRGLDHIVADEDCFPAGSPGRDRRKTT